MKIRLFQTFSLLHPERSKISMWKWSVFLLNFLTSSSGWNYWGLKEQNKDKRMKKGWKKKKKKYKRQKE
jgi:hypothetical protein